MSSGDLGGVSCPSFDQLAPPPHRSELELNDFFNNAKDILRDAEDWKAQFNVLNEIQRMAKYSAEILCCREGILASLVDPLSQMCASLRSSLARAACQTVTVLSQTIPTSLARVLLHASSPPLQPTRMERPRTSRPPKLEALIKSLILKATSPAEKKFIHTAAEEAGDAVAAIPQLADGVSGILLHTASHSKNSKVIGRCGVMLNRILESRVSHLTRVSPSPIKKPSPSTPQAIQTFLHSAVSLLCVCLQDRLAESRAHAKTTVDLLKQFAVALDQGRTDFFQHMLASTFAQVGSSISSPSLRLAFCKATQGESIKKTTSRLPSIQKQTSSRNGETTRSRLTTNTSTHPHASTHPNTTTHPHASIHPNTTTHPTTLTHPNTTTHPTTLTHSTSAGPVSQVSPSALTHSQNALAHSHTFACGLTQSGGVESAASSPGAVANSRPSSCVEERGVSMARIRESNLFGTVGLPPRLPSSLSFRKLSTMDSCEEVKPVIVVPPELLRARGRNTSSSIQQRRRSVSLCRPKTFHANIHTDKLSPESSQLDGDLQAVTSTASSSCLSSHIPLAPRDSHRRASSLCQSQIRHLRENAPNKFLQPKRPEKHIDPPDWLGTQN